MEPGLQDWTELPAALDRFETEYLILGGVAVGIHAEPRYTKDLDILVHVGPQNLDRLFDALRSYGAPLHSVQKEEFLAPDFVYFFGHAPWRVDILTSIPGADFVAAYQDRVEASLGGYRAKPISKEWLVRAKRASGRAVDMADLEVLELNRDRDKT